MIENAPYQYKLEWYEILDSKGYRVATGVDLKRADFIIKAVNNHDRLVEELTHVVKALETVSSFGATTPIIEHAKQLLTEIKHDIV